MEDREFLTLKEALDIIGGINVRVVTETIRLEHALNRVLAEPVIADVNMPPFDKAAMDGYACRRADLGGNLAVIAEIPAGSTSSFLIGPGQCARIMTGAIVPEGADFILMKEFSKSTGPSLIRSIRISENNNICYCGEDVKAGDVVLNPGTRLLPAHIAMLAATGYVSPLVFQLPRMAVLSTGNELVEPAIKPQLGKIRNTNGMQLSAQASQFGLTTTYLGIAGDDKQQLFSILANAVQTHELVVVSGGVSVGDYDYMPDIITTLGAELLFHGLKMKPGKHFLLAKKGDHFIAGIPGNPVSSFVIFEVLVKPLLSKMMGLADVPAALRLPLETSWKRKKKDTLFFVPVIITGEGTAHPVEYHGSAHLQAYATARGIMEVPAGVDEIKKGELVYVRQI